MSDRAGIAAAIGRIPSGLFVLTAGVGEQATGALVSWVQQAGFAPPAVVVALRADRAVTQLVRAEQCFCLAVLSVGEKKLMGHFARGFDLGEPAFRGLELATSSFGVPYPASASTWLGCRVLAETKGITDHVLFCAEVIEGRGSSEVEPLVHVRKTGLSY